MPALRVLVVDDSEVARRLLVGIFAADPDLEVIGEAANGEEAYEKATALNPDVITMDLHMPAMNGFQATRKIMEDSPRPIVIVSSDDNAAHVARSFEALEAGALTVLRKPNLNGSGADGRRQTEELTSTIKLMAGVTVFRRRKTRRHPPVPPPITELRNEIEIVAIGSSTGGPAALKAVLETLPATLPVPILVAQHLARGFDRGLAEWLDSVTALRVALAVDGKRPVPGEALIAPHGVHLGVTKDRRIRLSDSRPLGGHRPAATFLFDSVARVYGPRSFGVILTGMGDDGTAGLRTLKAAGGCVLAQDEASCVVYGMPGAAVRAGVVTESMSPTEIGLRITESFRLG
ncbi:MAG: chemotaxis-specific protein-glutamate methyltransferase CheB [Actinomycetota bacterium]